MYSIDHNGPANFVGCVINWLKCLNGRARVQYANENEIENGKQNKRYMYNYTT